MIDPELFQIIVEKGNKINIESIKGRMSDEIVEVLQENKLQHWSINLDQLDNTFLRLLSENTEVCEGDAIRHTLTEPVHYIIPKSNFINIKQIYILASKEEYLSFNKLVVNDKITGDVSTFFVDGLDDYLDFVCSITLEHFVKFGWLVTNAHLKSSLLNYYQAEIHSGYFRGLESVNRLQNYIFTRFCSIHVPSSPSSTILQIEGKKHIRIPNKVYPWEAIPDVDEWMTIDGVINSKKMLKERDNVAEKRRKLAEALRTGGFE